MAGRRGQQRDADLVLRPGEDERGDERQLERDVRRDPEPAPGDAAGIRLDEVGTAGPGGVDDQEFVEPAAEADEREGGGEGDGEQGQHGRLG